MSHKAPIGILDSGIGGLTIWREIRRDLPGESIIYIGDHAYQPYGERPTQEIRSRVKMLIRFLLQKNVKLIVIACNTATVAGIDAYRRWFPTLPILGVVPVVKTAAAITKTKHVAVISTPYTAASRYQRRLLRAFARGCRVENIGIPQLVQLIEGGETDGKVSVLLRQYLDPLRLVGVDVIALGCTHYPFIGNRIAAIVGKGISIIDSGGAVARHTSRILDAHKLRVRTGKPYTVFYTTGDAKNVSRVAKKLTGESIEFSYVRV